MRWRRRPIEAPTLPRSRPTFRDYLYVDLARVRSLLAQVSGGLPDSVTTGRTRGRSGQVALSPPVLGLQGGVSSGESSEETRTLSELLVPMLEERCQELGQLLDVPRCESVEQWQELRHGFVPGQLIRVDAPVRIFDPDLVRGAFDRMAEVMGTRNGGADSDAGVYRGLSGLTGQLFRGGLTIRAFPGGDDEGLSACHLSGMLLDKSEYIEKERAALFAQYGLEPVRWTLVARVARIPDSELPPSATIMASIEALNPQMRGPDGAIDRDVYERIASLFLEFFEQRGILERPVWPAVGVIALALYRDVEPSRPRPT